MIQMGGAVPERSIVSILTVSDVVASDDGTYLCGTSPHDTDAITVRTVQAIVPTQGAYCMYKICMTMIFNPCN